ncbi:MAG: helix-turn-helix transcriptional regulator [Clostridia bacterium]|nr:helix-turn-helix transcriptional regulator [Clostridia bacterium]
MAERNWSEYRLAIASGLSQSTVANIFNRNTTPSVATLESICAGFGISLAQFFAEGDMVELTTEQKEMFSAWSSLSKDQKEVLNQLIRVMKS